MRNTTREADENPAGVLLAAMMMGTSEHIKNQEAQGQADFVKSELIPVSGSRDGDEILTKLGFELGQVVADDRIWRHCKLPEGWKRTGTGHSMWSTIADENGFERVAVFYKAAFYDRSCHYSLRRAINLDCHHNKTKVEDSEKFDVVALGPGDVIIQTFGSWIVNWKDQESARAGRAQQDELREGAEKWLNEHYPDRDDPTKYWDVRAGV